MLLQFNERSEFHLRYPIYVYTYIGQLQWSEKYDMSQSCIPHNDYQTPCPVYQLIVTEWRHRSK